MTDLIVRQETQIREITTQNKAAAVLDIIRSVAIDPKRTDWFVQTELYRLGLRRKEGGE